MTHNQLLSEKRQMSENQVADGNTCALAGSVTARGCASEQVRPEAIERRLGFIHLQKMMESQWESDGGKWRSWNQWKSTSLPATQALRRPATTKKIVRDASENQVVMGAARVLTPWEDGRFRAGAGARGHCDESWVLEAGGGADVGDLGAALKHGQSLRISRGNQAMVGMVLCIYVGQRAVAAVRAAVP